MRIQRHLTVCDDCDSENSDIVDKPLVQFERILHGNLNGIEIILRILTKFLQIFSDLFNLLLQCFHIIPVSRFVAKSCCDRFGCDSTYNEFLPCRPSTSHPGGIGNEVSQIHRSTRNKKLVSHIIFGIDMKDMGKNIAILQLNRKRIRINMVNDIQSCINLEIITDGIQIHRCIFTGRDLKNSAIETSDLIQFIFDLTCRILGFKPILIHMCNSILLFFRRLSNNSIIITVF